MRNQQRPPAPPGTLTADVAARLIKARDVGAPRSGWARMFFDSRSITVWIAADGVIRIVRGSTD